MKDFGTVLNCIDGRVQADAAAYLAATFGVRYVDAITAPGMVQHLVAQTGRTGQVLADLQVSMENHDSHQVGVVAHSDCAGNPVSDKMQKSQVTEAMNRLGSHLPDIEIVGLWVDSRHIVERLRPA